MKETKEIKPKKKKNYLDIMTFVMVCMMFMFLVLLAVNSESNPCPSYNLTCENEMNYTIPVQTIYYNNTIECEECNEETYLSYEEYQSMSTRIKWLENRLKEVNQTDYIEHLELNLTRCNEKYTKCNSTLTNITKLFS